LSDGSSRDYDLVVGADGIYSTVDTVAMGAEPPVYPGQWCGAVFRRPAWKESPTCWSSWAVTAILGAFQ